MKRIKTNNKYQIRFTLFICLFVLSCLFFVGRVVYLQLNAPDIKADSGLTVRTVNVKAVRGEIFDRNGNKLVGNDYLYNIYFDFGSFPKDNSTVNSTLTKVIDVLESAITTQYYPLENADIPQYKDFDKDSAEYKSFIKMLDRFALSRDTQPKELLAFLEKRYGITDSDGNLTVDSQHYYTLIAIRYDMERQNFSQLNPFVLVSEAEKSYVVRIKEAGIRGVETEPVEQRIYLYPKYASHILGRTGKIPSDRLDYYTQKGYPMDAIVGIDGAEQAFEEYLRGIDGTLVIVEDRDGNIVDEYYKKEPVAGKDVYLTIDIELQKTAEDALAYNIQYIKEKADAEIQKETEKNTAPDGTVYEWAEIPQYIGEDVTSGAATLVNPNNGEIYALASNPTFDLSTYLQNYNSLLSAEHSPLFNRALLGTYEPGSTFKISVAAAALENGIITPNTLIYDSGVYKYYDDFQPQCWIYSMYGYGHGNMNVISAIQHSCNYFFYDVGRRLTIEKMNTYCQSLGLGEYTGIELPESKGILAGPAHRASINSYWVLGDTVQAAIGQSDNTFTPLQISMYLSSIVNGGTRYKAHLLHSVREYGTGEILYQATPSILNQVRMSDNTYNTIMVGMKNVIENGTAAPVFAGYPIDIGGKTGTAQVGKTKSNNGIFMAFAPFDNPEVVASCIIEQAGGSNDVGVTIKKMFNKYFNIQE